MNVFRYLFSFFRPVRCYRCVIKNDDEYVNWLEKRVMKLDKQLEIVSRKRLKKD